MKVWKVIFLVFLVIASVLIIANEPPYHNDKGVIFGTYYNISYKHKDNLRNTIEKRLLAVDNSLSPFNKKSIISAVNNNADINVDSLFTQVFMLAQEISEKTDGAFDITVAPLVNAWGFGFRKGVDVDSIMVDSMLQYIGYNKVALIDGKVKKQYPETMLDCSAIAKGFACDCVALLFDSLGIENYMVEIGGEVVAKGKNEKSKLWSIGINKPTDDKSGSHSELQEILRISGKSLATSGNYRNYRYENGRKVAHTIDPRSGYPIQHSLLSATVIADNCATADAYATAFMVMGLEDAVEICNANNIEGYFIYSDDNGDLQIAETEGFKKFHN